MEERRGSAQHKQERGIWLDFNALISHGRERPNAVRGLVVIFAGTNVPLKRASIDGRSERVAA